MIRNSKVIRKRVLVKPAGKRRIQRVESPEGNNRTLQIIEPKVKMRPRRTTKIRKESRGKSVKGFDWAKIKFSKVEPIWKGETVFLIGGGPSLQNFDFNLLNSKRTIAINKSFLSYPNADILYWTDSRVYSWYKKDIDKFKGEKYTIKPYGDLAKDIKILKNTGKGGLELEATAIRHGNNSGYAAMNLAYHLGVKRIVLLGFDMQNIAGKSHFHEGYPTRNTKNEVYGRSMIPLFASIVNPLKEKKIEVINACPNSALKFFKRLPIDKALLFS
jgi:hypothetical protein